MPDESKHKVIFIAGPTASGKSAAALALAQKMKGEIVNADAIQVYEDLRILSARPTYAETALAPHHLYGVVDGARRFSAGTWARAAATIIHEINSREKPAIVTGGTGLYFRALEEGLSEIPDIPDDIRETARRRLDEVGLEAFRREVVERDPDMAHLAEGDRQRLLRAWEVREATGKPLSVFQRMPRHPLIESVTARVVIEPERSALYLRCEARFDAMMAGGALDEARRLSARDLDPGLPVMKALGAAELIAHVRGRLQLDEAIALAKQNTRRFAKRQLTWFRNQAASWPRAADASTGKQLIEDSF